MEPTSAATGQDVDGASGRRRFLQKAGVAAGAAWVAPSIVSLTPAAAQGSAGGCDPTVIVEAADPCATGLLFQVGVAQGCPSVSLHAFESEDGGPFTSVLCTGAPSLGFFIGSPLSVARQFRIDWMDACAGSVLQSFLSPVYGGPACEQAGAAVDGSGPVGEIVLTKPDGTEERIPLD